MNMQGAETTKIYKSITVSHDKHYFTVFCTARSLETQSDKVMTWVDRLCGRLRWSNPTRVVGDAVSKDAHQLPEALFENQSPSEAKRSVSAVRR